jgi:hypothetical protein
MAFDTDNNFIVSGTSAEAQVATDFVGSAHHQVMKVAFGDNSTATRVTSSDGLPVNVLNASLAVTGTVSLNSGTTVNIAVPAAGITVQAGASGISIRTLSAGTAGYTSGVYHANSTDVVAVVGLTNGYPITVKGTSFDIRLLTAGTAGYTSGVYRSGSTDVVAVVGLTNGYPVNVRGTSFDIRLLTAGTAGYTAGIYQSSSTDMVAVVGISGGYPVNIAYGPSGPYDVTNPNTDVDGGMPTRILRASTGGDPKTTRSALEGTLNSVEDTVRVVGLSGAYPVRSLAMGLSAATGSPIAFKVNNDGALSVVLDAGTIGVTAEISGFAIGDIVIKGVSLAGATQASQVLQVMGYTGSGVIPIAITGTANIGNTVGVTGSVTINGSVAVTNTALTDMTFNDIGGNKHLRVNDPSLTTTLTGINTGLGSISTDTSSLVTAFGSTLLVNKGSIKVAVQSIAQPTGITSGKIAVPVNTSAAFNFPLTPLESGVHFKSDLSNTNATIFIGSSTGVTNGNGYPLYNGDQIFIETGNMDKIYVSSTAAGATLYYIGT